MDIRCRKGLCKYNDRFVCKAKAILVDRGVKCSTFEKDDTKRNVQDVTKRLFEQQPNFAPQRDSKTLDIKCNADCQFNHNGICVSNGITLNPIKEVPYCISYLRK
ncbi:MAG: hypothetical protein J6K97_03555 [Clostridia bacterium]|nr:hypothetical protein [Clostridia bacterium]